MSAGGDGHAFLAALLGQWVLFLASGGVAAATATLAANSCGVRVPLWVHAATFVGVGLVVRVFKAGTRTPEGRPPRSRRPGTSFR
jgi:hypothetical protein